MIHCSFVDWFYTLLLHMILLKFERHPSSYWCLRILFLHVTESKVSKAHSAHVRFPPLSRCYLSYCSSPSYLYISFVVRLQLASLRWYSRNPPSMSERTPVITRVTDGIGCSRWKQK